MARKSVPNRLLRFHTTFKAWVTSRCSSHSSSLKIYGSLNDNSQYRYYVGLGMVKASLEKIHCELFGNTTKWDYLESISDTLEYKFWIPSSIMNVWNVERIVRGHERPRHGAGPSIIDSWYVPPRCQDQIRTVNDLGLTEYGETATSALDIVFLLVRIGDLQLLAWFGVV